MSQTKTASELPLAQKLQVTDNLIITNGGGIGRTPISALRDAIADNGALATGLNAEMLNGKTQPHVGEILTSPFPSGTSPIWIRIGETIADASRGASAFLSIYRAYGNGRPEAYALAIAIAFDRADVQPLATARATNNSFHYLTKVRVCSTNTKAYIDIRYEASVNNGLSATAFGGIHIYDPDDWVKNPPTDGMTVAEFEI